MDIIACGWFTPDYKIWWDKLRDTLDVVGIAHDFREVDKTSEFWEQNTMRKATFALDAHNAHPDKTVLFLDVDCQITGTRDQVHDLCNIDGDVGVYIKTRFNSKGRPRFRPRSGTLVLRPTQTTRRFLENWIAISSGVVPFSVDEASLLVALGSTPGLTITTIPQSGCAIKWDENPAPIILHDSASVENHTPRIIRYLRGAPFFRGLFPAEM